MISHTYLSTYFSAVSFTFFLVSVSFFKEIYPLKEFSQVWCQGMFSVFDNWNVLSSQYLGVDSSRTGIFSPFFVHITLVFWLQLFHVLLLDGFY